MEQATITQEFVLEKVRQRLGSLDGKAEQAVAEAIAILNESRQFQTLAELKTLANVAERNYDDTMKILNESQQRKPLAEPTPEFVSTNVSVAQYEAWSPEERFQYLNKAQKVNARWIEQQFQKLNAAWVMVIDGQVVAYDADVQKLLRKLEFAALCEKYGKYPFVFFNSRLFMIEEATAWHATKEPADSYPTIPVKLRGDNGELAIVADFDTGAIHGYCDFDLLLQQGLLIIDAQDYEQESMHLSQSFRFIPRLLWYSVQDQSGKMKEVEFLTFCIKNWNQSPFVAINANRTALVGRGLFHKLLLVVHLDFASRQTEIELHNSNA